MDTAENACASLETHQIEITEKPTSIIYVPLKVGLVIVLARDLARISHHMLESWGFGGNWGRAASFRSGRWRDGVFLRLIGGRADLPNVFWPFPACDCTPLARNRRNSDLGNRRANVQTASTAQRCWHRGGPTQVGQHLVE